jgi:hypothetical protein
MDGIETWVALVISSIVALVIAILVQLVIVPWQKKKILGLSKDGLPQFTLGDSDGECRWFQAPKCDANFSSSNLK